MMRKYRMASVIAFLFVIFLVGCTTMPTPKEPAQEVAEYVANFSYTPTSQATPGSAGFTFTIGNVNYKTGTKVLWFSFPQFDNLDKAISNQRSLLC